MKFLKLLIGLLFLVSTAYARPPIPYDGVSGANVIIPFEHYEVHEGDHFNISYSVLSIGALTTPTDTMTLSFRTPNTSKLLHLIVSAISSSGARFRLIEGKTGGGVSPTGLIAVHNSNRVSSNLSVIMPGTDDASSDAAGYIAYDATLFTGGTTLVDEYIGADGQGNSFASGSSRGSQEWILDTSQDYQLSIFEDGTVPGTIQMSWYEHTH